MVNSLVYACLVLFGRSANTKGYEVSCGMAGQYRQDDNIKTLVRRAAVLPLVPVNEVEDMWFHALENNDNDTPEVTRFAYYVAEQCFHHCVDVRMSRLANFVNFTMPAFDVISGSWSIIVIVIPRFKLLTFNPLFC
jgi:hypothetical protein